MTDYVMVPREVARFLNGEADLEGVWFGERHPTLDGLFWWRKYIGAALEAKPVEPVAWVRYSNGAPPKFVPVLAGRIAFDCSAVDALEYEPLYAAPAVQISGSIGYWQNRCAELEQAVAAMDRANAYADKHADELEFQLAEVKAQRDRLVELAQKSLDARNHEAKTEMSLGNAQTNFSEFDAEEREYEKAMIEASEADKRLRSALAAIGEKT